MPVLPTALTTRSNFKAALRVSGSTDDAVIDSIINRTTDWIESRTERNLKARNYNGSSTVFATTGIDSEDYLVFDGDCNQRNERGYGCLYVPQFPIQKQTVSGALAVQLAVLTNRTTGADGAGDTWDTTSLLEGRDYLVDYKNGIITLTAGVFTTGQKNYRLKCTAGFVVGTDPWVPGDLEQLCIELGKLIYKDRKNLQSESIGTWSRTFNAQAKDPFVEDTLAKYRRFAL